MDIRRIHYKKQILQPDYLRVFDEMIEYDAQEDLLPRTPRTSDNRTTIPQIQNIIFMMPYFTNFYTSFPMAYVFPLQNGTTSNNIWWFFSVFRTNVNLPYINPKAFSIQLYQLYWIYSKEMMSFLFNFEKRSGFIKTIPSNLAALPQRPHHKTQLRLFVVGSIVDSKYNWDML